MYLMVAGTARVHVGGEQREIDAPAVASVENISDKPPAQLRQHLARKNSGEDGLSRTRSVDGDDLDARLALLLAPSDDIKSTTVRLRNGFGARFRRQSPIGAMSCTSWI